MGYNVSTAVTTLQTALDNKNPADFEEAIQKAIKLLNVDDTIYIEWCVDDVLSVAEEYGWKCTKDQAQDALKRAEHYHDCEYGFTWTHLKECLYDIIHNEQ